MSWPDPLKPLGAQTWLHRWPAGLKLALLLGLASSFVLLNKPVWLAFAAVGLFVVWRHVTGPIDWHAWRQVRWLALTVVVVVLYVWALAGMTQALTVLFRLLALLFAAFAVMATTSVTEMMAVVQRVLEPLGRRGWVHPEKVALTFGLCLRLVPVLLEQWQEIREAQAARGVSAAPHALLVPMLVRTMQRAEELAQAIDSRADF